MFNSPVVDHHATDTVVGAERLRNIIDGTLDDIDEGGGGDDDEEVDDDTEGTDGGGDEVVDEGGDEVVDDEGEGGDDEVVDGGDDEDEGSSPDTRDITDVTTLPVDDHLATDMDVDARGSSGTTRSTTDDDEGQNKFLDSPDSKFDLLVSEWFQMPLVVIPWRSTHKNPPANSNDIASW